MKSILFNTDMVEKILLNQKTVTRRVIKFSDGLTGSHTVGEAGNPENPLGLMWAGGIKRPPYQPGDILYVRETWQEVYETEYDADAPGYCVDVRSLILNFDSIPKVEAGISTDESCAAMAPRMKYYVFKASDIEYADPKNGLIWRPSIHMPREAARIFLKVTDVWPEQLYFITGKQARAEGFLTRDAFIRAFLTMYPDCTVKSWVWVTEFERISKEEALANE